MAVHLFIKFTCENTGFEIQLTKQASLNLEKENLPLGEKDVRDFIQNKRVGGGLCGFFTEMKTRKTDIHTMLKWKGFVE